MFRYLLTKLGRIGGKNKDFAVAAERRKAKQIGAVYLVRLVFFDALGRWAECHVEIGGIERILVLAQRRVVGRHRHGELRRQTAIDQSRAFEFIEPRQIADILETEMLQERLRWCRR